tara:strand:- start:207762 stop:209384 length:1623 start_codon:yes stop_codon:yes gene_type:complete
MNTEYRLTSLIAVLAAAVLTSAAFATEPMRIWVDETGRYSIDARLVKVNESSIVLLRKSGGTVELERSKISERDRLYVEEVAEALQATPNELRLTPPKRPEIVALPILDLPSTDVTAPEDSELISGHTSVLPLLQLPVSIEPDATPIKITFQPARYSFGQIGVHDVVSHVHPILHTSDANRTTTTNRIPDDESETGTRDVSSIALSISSGMRLPGQSAYGRIMRFDADSNRPVTVWQGDETIQLFDHHHPSGRSLVLVGHSPAGHGGQLAIASGWEAIADSTDNHLTISHRRNLPAPDSLARLQTVRWARWIDEEHVCVLLDRTIAVWNLVSGEQVFRINGIIEKSRPAISAGRRYVAVPGTGTVDLFRTTDGKPLGRIAVEGNGIPAVEFSPRGDALAIATSRRLRVWDLDSAALRADVHSRRNLGNDRPLWISDDLVMSGSGVLSSLFRGVPIWQYDVTGALTTSLGKNVAVLRKSPTTELSIVSVPHDGALDAIQWIDNSPRRADLQHWRLPGRSVWADGRWTDRDVRLSTLGTNFR